MNNKKQEQISRSHALRGNACALYGRGVNESSHAEHGN
jgi:hypothetical protein